MKRTIAVTGTASGIGKATAQLLEEYGNRIIRIDLREGDVCADLSTSAGRQAMVDGVRQACGGKLDGVVACAGLSVPAPPGPIVQVNYFGALATLEGLRPMLAQSPAPRAVAVTSWASIQERHPALETAMLANDEALAVDIAQRDNSIHTYATTKAALARWLRNQAVTAEWLGAGILLNGVAPGLVATHMTQNIVDNPEVRAQVESFMPRPMGRDLQPRELAEAMAWLISPQNSAVCGQVLFVDGGAEVAVRRDTVW